MFMCILKIVKSKSEGMMNTKNTNEKWTRTSLLSSNYLAIVHLLFIMHVLYVQKFENAHNVSFSQLDKRGGRNTILKVS